MAYGDSFSVEEERRRLEQRIASLEQQSAKSAQEYRNKLSQIQQKYSSSLALANKALQDQQKKELDLIASKYSEERRRISEEIEKQRRTFEQRFQEENEEIYGRISQLNDELVRRDEKDRKTAEEYMNRMHHELQIIRERTEIQKFFSVHDESISYADNSAAEAFRIEQYQATIAIMVNTSALLRTWEAEATSQWGEWKELFGLCKQVVSLIETLQKSSLESSIECDGLKTRVDLERYDTDGYARIRQLVSADQEQLMNANSMSIEEMRVFFHNLERDQRIVDNIVQRSILLHRAHVRKLKCLLDIIVQFPKKCYKFCGAHYKDDDLSNTLLSGFEGTYSNDRIVVALETIELESSRFQISVKYYPSTTIDSHLKSSRCDRISSFITRVVSNSNGMPDVRKGSPIIDKYGIHETQLQLQYRD